MKNARKDGLYLLVLGIAVLICFGFALRFTAKDSMADFKVTYYGTRCLLQNCDPYSPIELLHFYKEEFGQLDATRSTVVATPSVNLPSTMLLMVPFAILPFGLASALWMTLTAICLILAAVLTWDIGVSYAPVLSGAMIGFLIANGGVVFANGNAAGPVVGLCAIAVWCFLKGRFVFPGVVCLAISLAVKPHDAGLVWIYFLFVGGALRLRALQTLAITIVLALAAVLWVSHASHHWLAEMNSNLVKMSARGSNNDPGPAGLTSRDHSMEAIIDLQAAISVFRDDPHIYNLGSYLICGVLLLVWAVITLSSEQSMKLAWFALAAVTPLTMLVTYHRAYDAKLLMLTIPACAALWAEGGPLAFSAFVVNALGIAFTGEIPLAFLFFYTKNLQPPASRFFAKIMDLVLMLPASLVLLMMAVFYLWAYWRAVNSDGRTLRESLKNSLIHNGYG